MRSALPVAACQERNGPTGSVRPTVRSGTSSSTSATSAETSGGARPQRGPQSKFRVKNRRLKPGEGASSACFAYKPLLSRHWGAKRRHGPRGHIRETLAVFLKNDPIMTMHFRRSLRSEIRYQSALTTPYAEFEDICDVCHKPLGGYGDGTCVKCANTGICSDCVQIFEPSQLVPNISEEDLKRSRWSTLMADYDTSPMRRGDRVCLMCGVYSPTAEQIQAYDRFITAHNAIEALLDRRKPYGLLCLAFAGWQLYRSKIGLLLPQGPTVIHSVADCLTLAETAILVLTSRYPLRVL